MAIPRPQLRAQRALVARAGGGTGHHRPLTNELAALKADEDLCVPTDGRTITTVPSGLLMRFHDKAEAHRYRTHIDRERDGVWVFLRRDGGSA